MDEFLPSEWSGNYTCADDKVEVKFILNFTKSSSSISLKGDMHIDGNTLETSGSFASYFKSFAIQSDTAISNQIAGRNFTKVELNGQVWSSIFIDGAIVFTSNTGKYNCSMELRRQKGEMSL